MRQLARIVTGSLLLAAPPWVGTAAGGSFDEALGANAPGILVESEKIAAFAEVEGGHEHLATDTHDALVGGGRIDQRLLDEGRIHRSIEGPIGPDDPSVTGEIRPRPRNAARQAAALLSGHAGQNAATQTVFEPAASQEPAPAAADPEEPLLITDRVSEAEPISAPTGWVESMRSAFSGVLKRRPW